MKCCAGLHKYVAEFFGTFLLVAASVGTAVFTGGNLVAAAFAFGISLMLCVVLIGPISGSHVNPAVSIAMALRKKLGWKDFGFYVVAQIIGAIVGGLFVFAIVRLSGTSATGLMGANYFYGTDLMFGRSYGLAMLSGLIIEITLTFIFIFAIFGITAKAQNKWIAPVMIGFALTLVHFVAIPLTGTSVNPARSIGSAVFGGTEALAQLWLFLVAPMIGGVLAAIAAKFFFKEDGADAAEATPAKEQAAK